MFGAGAKEAARVAKRDGVLPVARLYTLNSSDTRG